MPMPTFLTEGNTRTHTDLSRRFCGIPFSWASICFRTVAESPRRLSILFCATAGKVTAVHTRATSSFFFMVEPFVVCFSEYWPAVVAGFNAQRIEQLQPVKLIESTRP